MDEQRGTINQEAHAIKERAAAASSEAVGLAKREAQNLGRQAQDRVEQEAEVRKAGFADELQSLGRAFEKSGHEIGREGDSFFTEPLQQAARFCEGASQSLRNKSPRELFAEVEAFGRRQPAALLGITMAAGFLATRLLRSDTKQAQQQQPSDLDDMSNHSVSYTYEGRH